MLDNWGRSAESMFTAWKLFKNPVTVVFFLISMALCLAWIMHMWGQEDHFKEILNLKDILHLHCEKYFERRSLNWDK